MSDGIGGIAERAAAAFARRFGARPVAAAWAPGRVNLIGEHTDYSGGYVLPIAIDRWTVAVGGLTGGQEESSIWSCELEEAGSLEPSRDEGGGGGWARYAAGVVAEMRERAPGAGRVRIAAASSIPLGCGLASSASFEVAVCTLLGEMWGVRLDGGEKAALCQRAEQGWAGVPCGIMDQLASVMGAAGSALLIDCEAMSVRAVELPAGAAVLVADSGVRHDLAVGEYARRHGWCELAAGKLGVPSLRHATPDGVERGRGRLDENEYRAARHVVSENARTLAAAGALERGDLAAVGALMGESHRSLRDDMRVSCAELDAMVDAAAGARGVIGARMTGGGFGGCVVAIVEESSVDEAAGVLSKAAPTGRFVDVVRAVDGCGVLR